MYIFVLRKENNLIDIKYKKLHLCCQSSPVKSITANRIFSRAHFILDSYKLDFYKHKNVLSEHFLSGKIEGNSRRKFSYPQLITGQ